MKSSSRFESKDDKNFRWKSLPSQGTAATDHNNILQVSNDLVQLPAGLNVYPNFISQEESDIILKEIQQHDFIWEGFEQRRKVQRYSVERTSKGENSNSADTDNTSSNMPDMLQILVDRVQAKTGYRPQYVTVEERSALTLKVTQYGSNGYNQVVTNFESLDVCQCCESSSSASKNANHCSCFMAEIPLRIPAVKHLNQPKRRDPICWDLETPQQWTDLRLDPNSILIQTKDCLWKWRSRMSALPEQQQQQQEQQRQQQDYDPKGGEKLTLLKFYSLPQSTTTTTNPDYSGKNGTIDYNHFGYVGSPETSYCSDPMPPLEDILTIIVTTSPIKSNPSTEVIERVFETFFQNGTDFALKCRKVIVCDGFRQLDDGNDENKVSRRHTNAKQAMRNGICTSEQAENYIQFKAALRELCAKARAADDKKSPFHNAIVEELDTRHGYGFALRHALRYCIATPYVIVIQHDRTFMRPTPIYETARTMWHHRSIKYVTMSMRSNLNYRDIFHGKYGRAYSKEYDDMVLRLPELNLDSSVYGPSSDSVQKMVFDNPKVRKSSDELAESYQTTTQAVAQREWLKRNPNEPGKQQLTLSPVFFWYDNVHIAETAHYRDFVFDENYRMVAKGGFVEDKLSPVLTKTLERLGLKEGHTRFGCYLLDDHSGRYFTGHMDGGSYITKSQRLQIQKQNSREME